LDRKGVVLPQSTLDTVIEGRNRGIKKWEVQERAGMCDRMGQETSYKYMEYGLSPPGRIESRRNREMVKKQVRTMATAEKIVSGGDWYIPLWTADATKSMGTEERRRACCVRRRMRSVEATGTERCRRRQSATFRAQGALDKRRWSLQHTMRASGSCYRKSMCMGRRTGT
jgi:hypothetical protein